MHSPSYMPSFRVPSASEDYTISSRTNAPPGAKFYVRGLVPTHHLLVHWRHDHPWNTSCLPTGSDTVACGASPAFGTTGRIHYQYYRGLWFKKAIIDENERWCVFFSRTVSFIDESCNLHATRYIWPNSFCFCMRFQSRSFRSLYPQPQVRAMGRQWRLRKQSQGPAYLGFNFIRAVRLMWWFVHRDLYQHMCQKGSPLAAVQKPVRWVLWQVETHLRGGIHWYPLCILL